jgi:hypothetical protein
VRLRPTLASYLAVNLSLPFLGSGIVNQWSRHARLALAKVESTMGGEMPENCDSQTDVPVPATAHANALTELGHAMMVDRAGAVIGRRSWVDWNGHSDDQPSFPAPWAVAVQMTTVVGDRGMPAVGIEVIHSDQHRLDRVDELARRMSRKGSNECREHFLLRG